MRKNVDSDDGGAGGVEGGSMGREGGGGVVVDERRGWKWKVSRQVSAVMELVLPAFFLHTRAFQSAPAKKLRAEGSFLSTLSTSCLPQKSTPEQTGCVGRLGLVTDAREYVRVEGKKKHMPGVCSA